MATFRLRRFSCPETLRTISPHLLVAFLKPHSGFLAARGVPLPDSNDGGLDYVRLAGTFASPGPDTPAGLIDALYYVDEMSTVEAADSLMAEADRSDVPIERDGSHTPADIAVQAWLGDSSMLERKHAEQYLLSPRAFEYFQTEARKPAKSKMPTRSALTSLEDALDDWFEERGRGRGCRVFVFVRDDGIWFLVRHGELYKREGSIEAGESSSVHYRPEKYDVLVYQPQIGELRIHARSKGEKQLYRSQFGKHLFGSETYFPGTSKYTLEPLREFGEMSLNCIDIEGLDWIKLKEVQIFYPGTPWEIVSRKSDDVFAALAGRKHQLPQSGRIIRGSFLVKFSDCKSPRSVVIRPSNVAQFRRDEDAAILEQWLNARGFITGTGSEQSERAHAVLAGD